MTERKVLLTRRTDDEFTGLEDKCNVVTVSTAQGPLLLLTFGGIVTPVEALPAEAMVAEEQRHEQEDGTGKDRRAAAA
jgi:hypothetical protein